MNPSPFDNITMLFWSSANKSFHSFQLNNTRKKAFQLSTSQDSYVLRYCHACEDVFKIATCLHHRKPPRQSNKKKPPTCSRRMKRVSEWEPRVREKLKRGSVLSCSVTIFNKKTFVPVQSMFTQRFCVLKLANRSVLATSHILKFTIVPQDTFYHDNIAPAIKLKEDFLVTYKLDENQNNSTNTPFWFWPSKCMIENRRFKDLLLLNRHPWHQKIRRVMLLFHLFSRSRYNLFSCSPL